MTKDPKPTRDLSRSLIYAMIPLGFILLVLVLITSGFWTQDVTEEPPVIVDEPPAPLNE